MLAISVRQPWAWLITRPDLTSKSARIAAESVGAIKDIENRNWSTKVRGRVLIHAAKSCTKSEFAEALAFAEEVCGTRFAVDLESLPRGGIVGTVEIVDCVTRSDSSWFVGDFGFVLRNARPLPFLPWKGQLGWFDVPVHALSEPHLAS